MPDNTQRIRIRERVRSQSALGIIAPSPTQPEAAHNASRKAFEPNAARVKEAARASATAAALVPAPSANAGRAASYEVGYRKPPRASQFQPGRSGNPKGRPKHAKNTRTIVTELLDRTIEVKAQGCSRKISVREASFQQIGKRAVEKGDLKSTAFLLDVESGGSGSPSAARHARSASNAESDSLAIQPSVLELEILAFAHRERLRDGGFGDEQIDAVLASLGLMPAVPANGHSMSAIAAN